MLAAFHRLFKVGWLAAYGASMAEEKDLTRAYRIAKTGPQPQGQGLNDLYVRFFRMAERQIAERSGRGIISYISNYSWLDGLSHPAMRERFLDVFDHVWIDNLHGNRIISEYAPDGRTSETVFAMQGSSPGIKIGIAIATFLRTPDGGTAGHSAKVHYKDFDDARAEDRRAALLGSLDESHGYSDVIPVVALGCPFKPSLTSTSYLDWPRLPELFPVSYPGVKTSRDAALISLDRVALEQRVRRYFDVNVSDAVIAQEMPPLMQSAKRFDAMQERKEAIHYGIDAGYFVPHCYRPMDVRWLYWFPIGKLLDEKRPDYFPQVFQGNIYMVSQQKPRRDWSVPQVIRSLGCLDLMDRGATCIPLRTRSAMNADETAHDNVSQLATRYLESVSASAEDLFFHSVALMHSPAYASDNLGGLAQDWPRIPLPESREALLASVALGREVAALLDTEAPVPGVTSGTLRPEIKTIAVVSRVGGGALKPEEFALTAGWGSGGNGKPVMPGVGKVERHAGSGPHPNPLPEGEGVIPERSFDVYLNAKAYWKNVPRPVWDFTIGGYQVMKKWLSYREQRVLGRALTMAEIMEVTAMARRLAALVLLQSTLDENYKTVAAATWAMGDTP